MSSKLSRWLQERAKAAKDLETTTIPTDYSHNRNWRALRFEDGDVMVKLTRHPSSWLLLNSEVLSQASPVFERSFSKRWGRSQSVIHPRTGEKRTMYTLSLVHDYQEGTYFLDSDDSPRGVLQEEIDMDRPPYGPFDPEELDELRATWPQLLSSSDFAPFKFPFPNEDWPEDEFRMLPTQTALDLQSFFAILYSENPALDDMLGPDTEGSYYIYPAMAYDEPSVHMHRHLFKHINNILSYANLYQCFHLVAAYLKKLLITESWVWEACGKYPWLVIKTAEALPWGELWDDCLRHIFKHYTSFEPDSVYYYATLGLTRQTFKDKYWRKIVDHENAVEEMRQGLGTMHLPALSDCKRQMYYGHGGDTFGVEAFSDPEQLAAVIACGIYANSSLARCSQLANLYWSEEYWLKKHATAIELDCLVWLYHSVIEAASSKNPAKIIQNIKPADAALKLKLPSICETISMTLAIKKQLSVLVIRPAGILENVFKENHYKNRPELTPARHPSAEYFTNYHIVEEDRPWQGPYDWEGEDIDMMHGPHQPAIEEWLEALGFFELDVTVD